jgi:hypothetical protein
MTTFLVGFIVGLSLAALMAIVIGPSRRVRAEERLGRDEVTRLLLGENPDEPTSPPEPVEHPRNYDTAELQALRSIGQPRSSGRRRN